eukprot:11127536-Heterocapsa_arctica.AAC.1
MNDGMAKLEFNNVQCYCHSLQEDIMHLMDVMTGCKRALASGFGPGLRLCTSWCRCPRCRRDPHLHL